jgi:hypothetical protein
LICGMANPQGLERPARGACRPFHNSESARHTPEFVREYQSRAPAEWATVDGEPPIRRTTTAHAPPREGAATRPPRTSSTVDRPLSSVLERRLGACSLEKLVDVTSIRDGSRRTVHGYTAVRYGHSRGWARRTRARAERPPRHRRLQDRERAAGDQTPCRGDHADRSRLRGTPCARRWAA